MFHTYVLASCGNHVDIDRALWLADAAIVDEALARADDLIKSHKATPFDLAVSTRMKHKPSQPKRADVFWSIYCSMHLDAHGEPFPPDINPQWDK